MMPYNLHMVESDMNVTRSRDGATADAEWSGTGVEEEDMKLSAF